MDATSRKNLEKLIKLLRKNGISHYKCTEFELNLSEQFASKPPRKSSKKVSIDDSNLEVETPYTEEDALFWSSAGIPDPINAQ